MWNSRLLIALLTAALIGGTSTQTRGIAANEVASPVSDTTTSTKPAGTTLDDDWRPPVERFGKFLDAISDGKLEDAWQQYRIMLYSPPKSTHSPFEPDPYENFVKQIGRFPSGLETLSVIGERRLTPNARKFTFIADTFAGPTVVNVLIYRSRGEWYFGTLNYQLVAAADAQWLQQMENLLPATRFATPYPLPLSQNEDVTKVDAQ